MKIKICGLTAPHEAEWLNTAHVDYAGMVLFFPKSKRNISLAQARPIMAALSPETAKTAVTVSPTAEQVRAIADAGFDILQVHGSLAEDVIAACPLPIFKAFNITDLPRYNEYAARPEIAGFVFDAHEPGSGKTFDWNELKGLGRCGKIFMLAGGLNAENVGRAIEAVRPDGVDVSSGVEYADKPGKSPELIEKFVRAVRAAAEK